MRIDWAFTADVKSVALGYDDKDETRTLTPTLVIIVNQEQAKDHLGERFAQVAFGTRDEHGQYGYQSIKPSLKCEQHLVSFAGEAELKTVPVVDKVEPLNVEQVKVFVKLPCDFDEDSALALARVFGSCIDVELRPAQAELPLSGKAA